MEHRNHHRPTTRRQALGEINGNTARENTNTGKNALAAKRGYVGVFVRFSNATTLTMMMIPRGTNEIPLRENHHHHERVVSSSFFLSRLCSRSNNTQQKSDTISFSSWLFIRYDPMTQHQGYIRTRSGRTPKAPIQSGHQGDVSMGKSGGTKSSSRNATGNNNDEGADVDAQNNKLGGSSRLAKHDPLQTYSQNLTSKELREVRDIDALDKQNPLAVTEFVNDMFNYWFRVEPLTRVSCNYMRSQTDINHKMRAILVDWLVEVHLKFKLMPETLFLTHNLIDRFLEKKAVSRKNLQLVGVTAMLMASKYEEIWAPEVRDFVYISDKAYTREQIIEMEKDKLSELGFHLTVPTPFHFLSRFFKAAGADKQMQLLANFLVECALVDYGALKFSNSMLAASCVYVAMRCLNKGRWDANMKIHTRYSESDILECADAVSRLQRAAPTANLSAVYKKYSNDKFMAVAKIAPADGLGDDMNS